MVGRSRNTGHITEDMVVKAISGDRPTACPVCGSMDCVRFGRTAKGTQRYRCALCGRTFVPGGPRSGTKLDDGVWLAYAGCYARGATVREVMAVCGVSRNTAYSMRHRVDEAMFAGHRRLRLPSGLSTILAEICSISKTRAVADWEA